MELIRPIELNNDTIDWTGQFRHSDIWRVLCAARDGDVSRLTTLLKNIPNIANAQFWYVAPLHFAVTEGHVAAVEVLLKHGADVTLQTLYGGETYLQLASDRNHLDVVEKLRFHFKEHVETEGERHEIHDASSSGDLKRVQELLEADASLADVPDQIGKRPIHFAVSKQHHAVVDCLLELGAQPDVEGYPSENRIGSYGYRPVCSALWENSYWKQSNDYVSVKKLLDAGANYTITIAAALGDEDRVRELLAEDRSLSNAMEPNGKRAISAAAERNHANIVRLLLDAGADPNLPEGPNCPKGYALWVASNRGFRDVAEMLLAAGADPNADVESSANPTESAHDKDMRALMYAHGGRVRFSSHVYEGNIDVVAGVLDLARPVITDAMATDAFTMCATAHHVDIVRLMLNRGFRVLPQVTGCQTYLWRDLEILRLLLDHGMDPNLPNWQNIRPLHHIARDPDFEAAALLIEYGADPSLVDEEYRTTPLGWAAVFGSFEFARFLLERFPERSIHAPSHLPDWAHPLEWARKRGHEDIANLIQTALA